MGKETMSDAETASWISSLLAGLGVSGSGLVAWIFKISNHSATQAVRLDRVEGELDDQTTHGHRAHTARIERLETDQASAVSDISATAATVARLDERTTKTGEEVTSILAIIRERS